MYWYKFMKAESYVNNFLVAAIKNGCGLLGLGMLKSAVSQEPTDKMNWFFVCWYKFRKGKVVKNGWGISDNGLLNQVYLTNEQIDWMIFVNWEWWNGFWFYLQFILCLWHLDAGGPLQLHLAKFVRKIFFGNCCWEMLR